MKRYAVKMEEQTSYNSLPLAACYAEYYGKETPEKSIKPPTIITEPLTKIYSKARLSREDLKRRTCKTVTITIYSSGIIIKNQVEKHKVQWFPIQNLYCSAGLRPESKKGQVVFKELHMPVKKPQKPFFAMVLRQERTDGRKVLVCYAFLVESGDIAQRLVYATQGAYMNKAGWNHPLTDKEFLNAKMAYTLERLDMEDGDDDLEKMTQERERQLAQKPDTSREAVPRPLSSRQPRAHSAAPVLMKSAPSTPRRSTLSTPRPQQPAIADNHYLMPPQQQLSSRVPTQRAITYYQGFKTETLQGSASMRSSFVVKSASISGFPLSRSSSNATGAMSLQPTPQYSALPNGRSKANGQKAMRHVSDASASKSKKDHRVLASSEPQELVNGDVNGNIEVPVEVLDWDRMEDAAPKQPNGDEMYAVVKKKGQSKHHRPSKKEMEKLLHNGEINGHESGQSASDRVSFVQIFVCGEGPLCTAKVSKWVVEIGCTVLPVKF